MKRFGLTIAVMGLLSVGQVASATAVERESIQRCMEAFAAQYFPNQKVTFVVRDNYSPLLSLVASTGTQAVQLSAHTRRTGEVLATATCQVHAGKRTGEVIVWPLESRATVE